MSTGIRNRLDPCLDEALQRWVGEGGADAGPFARATSVEHIETGAQRGGRDTQTAVDAGDLAAKRPAGRRG
jgi:hypothetical protein